MEPPGCFVCAKHREFWGADLRAWPSAPTVDEAGMRELVGRLRLVWGSSTG